MHSVNWKSFECHFENKFFKRAVNEQQLQQQQPQQQQNEKRNDKCKMKWIKSKSKTESASISVSRRNFQYRLFVHLHTNKTFLLTSNQVFTVKRLRCSCRVVTIFFSFLFLLGFFFALLKNSKLHLQFFFNSFLEWTRMITGCQCIQPNTHHFE